MHKHETIWAWGKSRSGGAGNEGVWLVPVSGWRVSRVGASTASKGLQTLGICHPGVACHQTGYRVACSGNGHCWLKYQWGDAPGNGGFVLSQDEDCEGTGISAFGQPWTLSAVLEAGLEQGAVYFSGCADGSSSRWALG